MQRAAIAFLSIALIAPCADAGAAPADACDALGATIAAGTGGKVGRRQGPSIDIRTPGGGKIDLTCRGDEPIAQSASSDSEPSAAYFAHLSAAAEAVTGEPAGSARTIIGRAYEAALRERRKSFVQQNGWSASCYTDRAGSIRTLCSVGRIPPG